MKNLTLFLFLLFSVVLNAQTPLKQDTLEMNSRCQNQNITYDVYCVALYPKQSLSESYVDIDDIKLIDNHKVIILYSLDNEMNVFVEYFIAYNIPYRIDSVYEYYDYNEAIELLDKYKSTYPNVTIIKKTIKYNN